MANIIKHPFPPIVDQDSRILILGSFPSVISRKQSFYYANKNNRFWKVMSNLFQEEIQNKEVFCHFHHIALWDVISSCSIQGSSDSTIKNVIPNDIENLVQGTKIHTIFTTGKTAGRLYDKYIHLDMEHNNLPSTSSANAAKSLEDLICAYRIIVKKIYEED